MATSLALLSDRRLGELVSAAPVVGSGIGGTAVSLEIEGTPVFAKRVPLSDLERRPEHVLSTANIFELPTFCHYGVGSAGGGAWRELAANVMATNWVLGGGSENFPLMYHWRVLPAPARTPEAGDRVEIARMVEFWDGSAAVGRRLDAITGATASVVLFLEHLPQNLYGWMTAQLACGAEALAPACAMVERELRAGVSFMNANGLLHFDAHFANILTDGERLYFADFGLANSPRFDLAPDERAFLRENLTHDGCYTMTQLVNWLVGNLSGVTDPAGSGPANRNAYIRRCAGGAEPSGMPAAAAAIVTRYAPVAAVMNDFYWKLHGESRTTRYPVEEIRRTCAATGFEPIRATGGAARTTSATSWAA